ncbi:hypothetical protein F0L68_30095 [Solihabitans fulvus]|uniref:Uncharacterized protein n=1 Tax=Solihabitans fulvus TaxID=1892852 RepID=A0A5B2WTV5_9PSEU|nr:hypothetical protein [Solihabitans fulvus]KAA2254438.1 hypothetical protein F0L68_30095 [Solihabitans fulvus]
MTELTITRPGVLPQQRTLPGPTEDSLADLLRQAAWRYRADHDWHTEIIGNQLMLSLGRDLLGVCMSAGRAGEINHQLRLYRLTYPVLPLPGPRPRWVFLASDSGRAHRTGTPYFVALLDLNQRIPLPPSGTSSGPLRWIVPPERCADGIPGLDPILAVIRTVAAHL